MRTCACACNIKSIHVSVIISPRHLNIGSCMYGRCVCLCVMCVLFFAYLASAARASCAHSGRGKCLQVNDIKYLCFFLEKYFLLGNAFLNYSRRYAHSTRHAKTKHQYELTPHSSMLLLMEAEGCTQYSRYYMHITPTPHTHCIKHMTCACK